MIKYSLIFALIFNFSSITFARSFDTLQIRKNLSTPVVKFVVSPNEGAYIIAGKESESLIFMNMRYKSKDFAKKRKISTKVRFSDLLVINDDILLVSTAHNGLFFVRNGATVHINKDFGLTDTNVVALLWDAKHQRVFVRSKSAYFVSADYGFRRYIRMTEADKLTMLDSGAQSISEAFDRYVREPVQQGISTVVAEVDYSFRPIKAIKRRQFKVIKKSLLPGDVLVKRNESELTNIGIPGFWTHTGFFLGNKREFNRYFADLPLFKGQKPTNWLKKRYPKVFAKLRKQRCSIVEAVGEGVVVSSLEHIAMVDHFAALRLNRNKEDVFNVLIQAFEYYGLPYDYLFDFETDKALVCSELVTKSINKLNTLQPIVQSRGEVLGKPFVTPSDIAHQYCDELQTLQPTFQFVLFYRANSMFTKAELKNSDEFCKLKLE